MVALSVLLTIVCGICGCAEEQKSGPPSVMDLLVEAEENEERSDYSPADAACCSCPDDGVG